MKTGYIYLKQKEPLITKGELIKFILGAFFGGFGAVMAFLSLWVIAGC